MDATKPNNSSKYLKTKVLTASPEQLQLMLYDGAIRFCEQARAAIDKGEIEPSYHLLCKAEKIMLELTNSLRDELAPEACANMRGLYLFCYQRLTEASMTRKAAKVDEALTTLRHLRETWIMVMEKVKAEKAQEAEQAEQTTSPDSSNQPTLKDTPTISLEG